MSSTTTITEDRTVDFNTLSDTLITDNEPLSFLYATTNVKKTVDTQVMKIVKETKDRIDRKEEIYEIPQVSYTITSYIPFWGTSTYKKMYYPELKLINNKRELKAFLEDNQPDYVPDTSILREYKFLSKNENYSIVSKLKDTNDQLEYFRRTFNRYKFTENEHFQNMKKTQELIKNNNIENVLDTSAILVNKKIRNMYNFINKIGSTEVLSQNQSLYSYLNNVEVLYGFIKFVGNNIVYRSARDYVIGVTLQGFGLSLFPTLLITGSVYLVINAYEAYSSVSQDIAETKMEKLYYAMTKGGCLAAVEAFKEFAKTGLGIGRLSIIVGSEIINCIMLVLDPKINRTRADALAKSYADGIDMKIVEQLMTTTQQSGIFFRFLWPTIKKFNPQLIVDYLGHLPESIVRQQIFQDFYAAITYVPEKAIELTEKYIPLGKYIILPIKYQYLFYKKGFELSLKITNSIWKITIQFTVAAAVIITSYFMINYVLKQFGVDLTSFVENFVSTNIETFDDYLKNSNYFYLRFVTKPLFYLLSMIYTHSTFVFSYLGNETLEFIKDVLLYIYTDHKYFVKFLLNMPAQMISSTIVNSLKPYTQQYLSAILPAGIYIQTLSKNVNSLEDYINVIENGINIGLIGIGLSTTMNILYTWYNRESDERIKSNIQAIKNVYRPKITNATGKEKEKLERQQQSLISKLQEAYALSCFYISNNVMTQYFDRITSLTNTRLNKYIEWYEINYGRRDIFKEFNFSMVTNKIILDNYANAAINDALLDVFTNIDVITEKWQWSNEWPYVSFKIKGINKEYEEVNLDTEKLKKIINDKNKINAMRKAGLINNIKEEKTILDPLLQEQKILSQTIQETYKLLEKDPSNIELRKQIVDIRTKYNSLKTNVDQLEISIGRREIEIEQLNFMETYFEKNKKILENPVTTAYTESANLQLKSIIYNKFIPWTNPMDRKLFSAFMKDVKGNENLVVDNLKKYYKKVQILEQQKNKIYNQIQNKGISDSTAAQQLTNINKLYEIIKSDYKNDTNINELVEYNKSLTEIVLKQYTFELAKTSTDIGTFYNINQQLYDFRNTFKSITKQAKFLEKENLVSDTIINDLSSVSKIYQTEDVKMFKEKSKQLKEKKLKEKEKPTEVETSKKETQSWTMYFLKPFIDWGVDFYYNTLKTLIKFGSVRKQKAKLKLEELKQMEAILQSSIAEKDDRRNSLLSEIARKRNQISKTLQYDMKIVNFVISNIPINQIDESNNKEANTIRRVINTLKAQETQIETNIKTRTTTDITTDIETSYDYDIVYDTAFGGDSDSGMTTLNPFIGDEIQQLEDLSNTIYTTSGNKVKLTGNGTLNKDNCIMESISETASSIPNIFCTQFFEHLPKELINKVQEIKNIIIEEKINFITSNVNISRKFKESLDDNLLYLWMVPEFREELSKFKFTEEFKKDLYNLTTTDISGSAVLEGTNRLYNQIINEGPQDWSNIYLLNMLSARVAYDQNITVTLEQSNLTEYLEIEDKIYRKNEEDFQKEKQEYEKLAKMFNKHNIEINKQNIKENDQNKGGLVSNIINYISKVFKDNVVGRSKSVGLDFVQTISEKIEDVLVKERDIDFIHKDLKQKIEKLPETIDKKVFYEQEQKWYEASKITDKLEYNIQRELTRKNQQFISEDVWYRWIKGYTWLGIYAPKKQDILANFFADDTDGIKSSFIINSGYNFDKQIIETHDEIKLINAIKSEAI
jgi:hypothetical protein